MTSLSDMLLGAIVMGFAVSALFFLRFWRQTHDRLFAFFAAAFSVMAVNRLALGFTGDAREVSLLLYAMRLAAFLLIVVAVVDKNRRSEQG
jgi:hypothetical protein